MTEASMRWSLNKPAQWSTSVTCCVAQVLFAQSASSPRDTVHTSYQLQQITVTALRYPEQLLKIPAALNIVNSETWQAGRGYGLDEALRFVPGVLTQSRAGNQDVRITVRGFGARVGRSFQRRHVARFAHHVGWHARNRARWPHFF